MVDVVEGWLDRLAGEEGPGGLPCNSTSTILESFRIVKAGAGTLFGFSGFNNGAGALFIQTFDASQLPADGIAPVTVLTAPAAGNFSVDWGTYGRAYSRGIIIVCSSTLATKTIGAASCWFDAQYV